MFYVSQISPNGIISLGNETFGYFPDPFPTQGYNSTIIAPFWTNIDTNSTTSRIYYHQYSTLAVNNTDADYLTGLSKVVRSNDAFITGGTSNFSAIWALVVTWDSVKPLMPKGIDTNEVSISPIFSPIFYSFLRQAWIFMLCPQWGYQILNIIFLFLDNDFSGCVGQRWTEIDCYLQLQQQ